MRKHKFRGIGEEDGKWHYGDLIHAPVLAGGKIGLVGIRQQGCYPVEVLPESVGEYTGLKDKNGVEIYEGDIIRKSGDTKVKPFDNNRVVKSPWFAEYVVGFNKGCCTILVVKQGNYYYGDLPKEPSSVWYEEMGVYEVIGNIHENKDE